MVYFKNIFVGFLVSFIGSIPLGYLNVVGFEIYSKNGFWASVDYLLGVIAIEFLVIYFTLIFAERLTRNTKLTRFIEGFSIFFMFVLALIFYWNFQSENSEKKIFDTIHENYFLAGLVLSSLNFIQIPFWTGWNLWLLSGQHIDVDGNRKFSYVLGTILGTFTGMLTLIITLHYFTSRIEFLSMYIMKIIIPIVFLLLGIIQLFKFYRKYTT